MFVVSIKGVLQSPDGKIVLLLNERDEWELPGGRIEIGESSVECLAREIQEELGISIEVLGFLDSYLFEVIPGRHVFIVTFKCALAGPFNPRLSHEHKKLGLFAPNALPQNLPKGYHASIALAVKSISL